MADTRMDIVMLEDALLKDAGSRSIREFIAMLNGDGREKCGVLAAYTAPQRLVYDWRDNPPVAPAPSGHPRYEAEDLPIYQDMCELDEICKATLISPTFRALVHSSTEIQNMPLYYDADEDRAGDAFFDPCEEIVGLPFHQWEKNELYPALLGHEFRHVWQQERVLTIGHMFPVLLHIALRRLNEADCTAMMITVAAEIAEISGNRATLEALRENEVYSSMTEAFLKATTENPAALWDGAAQRAAMLAYFQAKFVLNAYDVVSLKEEIDFLKTDSVPEIRLAKRAFSTLVDRHFSMPYEGKDGSRHTRPHYNDLKGVITPQILLRVIHPAVRQEAKRLDSYSRQKYWLVNAAAPAPF